MPITYSPSVNTSDILVDYQIKPHDVLCLNLDTTCAKLQILGYEWI